MEYDVLNMLDVMASVGTAPSNGCSLFGVGYDDAFNRIKDTYLTKHFQRGGSAEKFVVGPFGSGKTHFLRHLSEISRGMDCITAEITLNKDIDFTKSLVVYKELSMQLRCPAGSEHGIRNFIEVCVGKIRNLAPNKTTADLIVRGWVSGLDKFDFKLDVFGRVAKKAFEAYLEDNEELFEVACRWLAGEIDDREVTKTLGVSCVARNEHNLVAKRAMLSLFQLIKYVGFNGTVVCFDEAEQGLTVDKKKTDRILSMLMAGINSLMDMSNGSALIVYALTPDLITKMETFAALQQRITAPVGYGFFEGNTRAPIIDLTRRQDAEQELIAIGESLVELAYSSLGREISVPKTDVLEIIARTAEEIATTDITSSNRRSMVKNISSLLLRVIETGAIEAAPCSQQQAIDDEV